MIPTSNVDVTIPSCVPATEIVNSLPAERVPSDTVTVNVDDVFTDAVGVPDTTPVDAFNTRPAGNDPAVTDHEYGVTPPVAATVDEYSTPLDATGIDTVDTTNGFTTRIVNARDALRPSASVTVNVNDDVPVAVGVPDTTPVDVENVNPAGTLPDIDHVNGPTPPDTPTCWLYDVPVTPSGNTDVATANGTAATDNVN